MEPEVSQVQKSSLDNYESRKLGKSNPVDSAWVGVDDDFFAVGFLAKVQFKKRQGGRGRGSRGTNRRGL